nr:MAG TPA: hypothetical protein [Caudoviricetes sp.]
MQKIMVVSNSPPGELIFPDAVIFAIVDLIEVMAIQNLRICGDGESKDI